tara:strand:- start:37 stop:327 length:291 start_codon:yes stop_codon:yes gene_type:complete
MKKSNKKITKKDLEAFTPERVINDLNIVNDIVSKMGNLDESLSEDDAEKLKDELTQIESYLVNQYKDYMDVDGKEISLKELDIDEEGFQEDVDTEE